MDLKISVGWGNDVSVSEWMSQNFLDKHFTQNNKMNLWLQETATLSLVATDNVECRTVDRSTA